MPVLPTAGAVAASLGLDLSGHRARPLRPEDLAGVNLTVGFEPAHTAAAVEIGGASPERTFLLLELPDLLDALPVPRLPPLEHARYAIGELHRLRVTSGTHRTTALADPIGQPEQVVAEAARVIDAVTAALAAALFPVRAPGPADVTGPGCAG
jgi:protein-tyrosine-phosphatase